VAGDLKQAAPMASDKAIQSIQIAVLRSPHKSGVAASA
jgi:hypothetical protein